jgi:ABC-type Fe3+/spermidine/putrescine transport system ATPase subunit
MALNIEKISKRFGNNWVLRDVSLKVDSGEILGISGVSGAGKSTLLRIIAGVEKPNGGKIYDKNTEMTGSLRQNRFWLFPTLRRLPFWKHYFFSRSLSSESSEEKISALENFLQKAENVILLDNAFSSFDRLTREFFFAKLRRIVRDKNLKAILAARDFEEIFAVCDKVGILHNGEIQQTGTPREVYEKPDSIVSASLSGRINLIKARRLTSANAEIPKFQTLVGEHRLFTQKTGKRQLGAINQNISLAIRPEHISISFGASFPEDNLLKAKVTNVNFCGATTLVELDANGLILEALVLRLVGLGVGQECMVGLPPDRIMVLKD